MAYAVEILTYQSDFKTRIKAILDAVAQVIAGGWTVYPYRNLLPGGKYIAIWHGAGSYNFEHSEQWVVKSVTIHIDIIGGFRTEGFQTEDASDIHTITDDILPPIELALLTSFLDGFITSDFTDPPEYLWALGPELVSDSGELTERAAGINGQVIGESLSFNVDFQLNITGA